MKNETRTPRSTDQLATSNALHARLALPLSPRVKAALRVANPSLPIFDTGQQLVAFQRDKERSWEPKDAVLATLVRLVAGNPCDREPIELLLAALWPAVDREFQRRVKIVKRIKLDDLDHGPRSWPDETWARVMTAFLAAVQRYPLARRSKKIANNVKFLIRHALDDRDADAKRLALAETQLRWQVDIAEPQHHVPEDYPQMSPIEFFARSEEAPAPYDSAELEKLERRLANAGLEDPIDRTIVIGVTVHELPYADIARSVGITCAAARKRFQRAREKLVTTMSRTGIEETGGDDAPR